MNYFELLNIPPAFDLDSVTLGAAYFREQRAWHPDRFAGKSSAEKQQALARSADLNKAYDTLKNPLSRAQYLLHLQGIAVGTETGSVEPPPGLLMEAMQWREQMEEGEDLKSILSDIYQQCIDNLSKSYRAADWRLMAETALRLGYVVKTQQAMDPGLRDDKKV